MSRDENPHRDNELDYSSFDGFHAQLDYKITNVPKKCGETLVGTNTLIANTIFVQADLTIRHNIEIFHVMLSNSMFRQSVCCSAKLFDGTLHHLCVRCTIRHYAESFHATLLCLYVRTGGLSSICEMIILRNNSNGGIIRVCKGIFTTTLVRFPRT